MRHSTTHLPSDAAPAAREPWRRRFVPHWLRREKLAGQIVRFGVVGGINTVVDFGTFNVLAFVVGIPIVVAYPIAITAGVTNSFIWNKHWTFSAGGSGAWSREAVTFMAVSVGGLVVNYLGFLVLHFLIGESSPLIVNLEKLAASVLSMTWNFIGYRYVCFPVRGTERAR